MSERIQNIIGRLEADRKAALTARDFRAARSLRNIQIKMAHANLQGWFAQDADNPVETSDDTRRFSPEQLQGLESIGFTFVMDAQVSSLDQLSINPLVQHLFGHITHIPEVRKIVPVARQVAVNPEQPYAKGSQDLGYDDQLEVADEAVRKLRASLKERGRTLEGISFASDKASVLVQLDFAYQNRFGQTLYPNYFVNSQDECVYPRFGPRMVAVGRHIRIHRLSIINEWRRDEHFPYLRLALVATPIGPR